jgi:DNA-binding NtrC family response regulator
MIAAEYLRGFTIHLIGLALDALPTDGVYTKSSIRTLDATTPAGQLQMHILDQPMTAAVQHLERTMVKAALAKAGGVDGAARLLGLSRKGLYLKRLRYGMEIDRPGGETGAA